MKKKKLKQLLKIEKEQTNMLNFIVNEYQYYCENLREKIS